MTVFAILAVALASSRERLPRVTYAPCLAYQQSTWQPDDVVAEACMWRIGNHRLYRRLRLAFTGRLSTWLDEFREENRAAVEGMDIDFPRYEHRPGVRPGFDSSVMEGHQAPIDVKAARAMFRRVLFEESEAGLPPRVGEPHVWSRTFRRRHPGPKASRILVTLSFGRTSWTMRTGNEASLLEWILAQPDESVTIEALFRRSYQLSEGDVYQAILTIENVLSRHFLDPRRNQLELVHRLRPITNTWGHRGDRFGPWYHLFGTLLHGYSRGSLAGSVSASAEAFGSKVSNEAGVVEIQESYINRTGARLGGMLRRDVRRGFEAEPGVEALTEASYMRLTEFYVP